MFSLEEFQLLQRTGMRNQHHRHHHRFLNGNSKDQNNTLYDQEYIYRTYLNSHRLK